MPIQTAVAIAIAAVLAACGGPSSTPSASSGAPASLAPSAQASSAAPPEAKGSITWAISHAVPQVPDAPRYTAVTTLKSAGYDVKDFLFLEQANDVVQAVTRGDADVGLASSTGVLTAIGQGVPIVVIMAWSRPDYVVVAPVSVADVAGLQGLRFGIHGEVSTTTWIMKLALQKAPGTQPNVLIVPGSANRIQALAAGQLDASAIQLGDEDRLEALAPGKFHVIYDVGREQPNAYDQLVFVSKDTLAKRPDMILDLISASLNGVKEAYADPNALAQIIAANVPKTDAATAATLAARYTESQVWLKDGGLTEAGINATVSSQRESGLLKTDVTFASCCDRTQLDAALAGQ